MEVERAATGRWREIPSPAEATIAVIVQASDHADEPLEVSRAVMQRIATIYRDAELCRPVFEGGLRMTLSP